VRATAKDLGLERADESPAQISTHTLPSGLVIQWAMPDLFSVLSFTGTLPDPITAAVIKLLVNEGSLTPEDDPRYYHQRAEFLRGLYGIAAAGLVSPKLDLAREWGDGNGTIGRRELSWADIEQIYYSLFRFGSRGQRLPAANTDDAAGTARPASAGGDVPPAAE
jgi:hypothetical protein